MTTRAAIYCRISKDTEGTGLGVDRQERECRELCTRRKLDVIDVFTDNDISAFKGKRRPGFNAAQDAMKAGTIDVLVAWHPDRLTRHARELEDLIDLLEATGVDVLTVGAGPYDLSTATGKLQARIVGSVARYESEHKAERQRSKMDELALSGAPAGGRAPYGYRWEHPDRERGKGNLLVDHDEARELRKMASRVLEGWSALRIERDLNERGVQTKEGRPWHHSTVRAVLINPTIAGLRVHRREIAGPGSWKPILDRETWEQVRATIADPARKRERPVTKHLLTGLVRSAAGDPMNGKPERGRRSYSTAQRRDSQTGEWINPAVSTSVDADKLEAYVIEAALIALRDWRPSTPTTSDASEIAEIEQELAELAKLRGERVISMAEWLAARAPLEAALVEARSKIRAPRATVKLLEARDIRKAWQSASIDEQRQALAAVIDRVIVDRAARGRWTTMAERVRIVWRS
jgi:site-specific DNA recombinase